MPISLTSPQKKNFATLWAMVKQTPLQFVLTVAPDPLLLFYKKRTEVPSAEKVLNILRAEVTGFNGTSVFVGQVRWDKEAAALRVEIDKKRSKGTRPTDQNFKKAWKAGARLAALDGAGLAINTAKFGPVEEEDVPVAPPQPAVKGTPAAPRPAPPRVEVQVWKAAQASVVKDVIALKQAIQEKAGSSPRLRVAFERLDTIARQLDRGLLATLEQINVLTAAEARGAAVTRALTTMGEIRTWIERDPIVAKAERQPNGFDVVVRIRAPILQALDSLERSLR